ncbi:MAG: DUF4249 family protein [Ignavibacteria bacterium]|nr:DUF4249 family protein [Ignavibacteria bacterium]
MHTILTTMNTADTLNTDPRRGFAARMKHSLATTFAIFGAAALLLLSACEDAPPNSFVPVPFVEAYLFVDRPIEGIVIASSQSLSAPFEYESGMLADADVQLSGGGNTYALAYRVVNGAGSYWYPDTTALIQPSTAYTLTVRLKDGGVMTASTTTPERIAWMRKPAKLLQYPTDTTKLQSPDSLRIQWTPGNTQEFIIRIQCLDTLAYGAYLTPPTNEDNGRTNNLSNFETPKRNSFYSTTRWGFIQATGVPTVWTGFRWYGRNAVAIIAPDKPFLDWFKMTRFSGNPQYNPQFSNIRGGTGIFASASLIEEELFLLKRVK